MLWRAGQQRVGREQGDRMAEMFGAFRDALQHSLVPVVQMRVDKLPVRERPFYLPTASPGQALRTPADRDRMLTKLGSMFPGMVRRADS